MKLGFVSLIGIIFLYLILGVKGLIIGLVIAAAGAYLTR